MTAALTAAQIVTMACQIAKVPGMTAFAGQLLNGILQELSQTYNFEKVKRTQTIQTTKGYGPYPLNSDFLRTSPDEVFYTLAGTPYSLTPMDYSEFENLSQTSGLSGYPTSFATDIAQDAYTVYPNVYFWPAPGMVLPITFRYYSQPADITTPETSTTIPWFPNSTYLYTRLAGELMKISDDQRQMQFLGEGPDGAQGILRRYLSMKEDHLNRAETVKLDRRRFNSTDRLKNTKRIGW